VSERKPGHLSCAMALGYAVQACAAAAAGDAEAAKKYGKAAAAHVALADGITKLPGLDNPALAALVRAEEELLFWHFRQGWPVD
jgi:hypothetical protein